MVATRVSRPDQNGQPAPTATAGHQIAHPHVRGDVLFGGGTSVGSVSAMDTLYFPANGPVFNLPSGFSLNMPGLNVIDNQVVGPTAEGVPEPATALVIVTGLLGIVALRRRHTKA